MDATTLRCTTCSKTFSTASESSYRRHVTYCRRALALPRVRTRSCRGCSASKKKCISRPKCNRCLSKGIECVFDGIDIVSDHDARSDREALVTTTTTTTTMTVANPSSCSPSSLRDTDWLRFDEHMDMDMWLNFPTPVNPVSLVDPPYMSAAKQLFSPLTTTSSASRACANVILQHIRSYPLMMLRRETFPPFIHAHTTPLPAPIVNCMRIADMYRRQDGRAFLWRTVRAEYDWIIAETASFSPNDLFAAVQAQLIYLVMRILDPNNDDGEYNMFMVNTFRNTCYHYAKLFPDARTCWNPRETHSQQWPSWVNEEARRRTTCVNFVIARVVSFFLFPPCTVMSSHENVVLPTPRTLWEARSAEEWLVEYPNHVTDTKITTKITTVQDLAEASDAQAVDRWNCGADGLGVLLNLAINVL